MIPNLNNNFLDSNYSQCEQLPRDFCVSFSEQIQDDRKLVSIAIENTQIGNFLTDNSYSDDGYRYHDIFHFSYVAFLGWSPCMRKMLNKKRKSNWLVDEIEDGARAAITEETITFFIYTYAKENNFFENATKVDKTILEMVKKLSADLEIKDKTEQEWEKTILKGYEIFRLLRKNKGGNVLIDMYNRRMDYIANN
jgi:MazG C-terminal domain